jgi:L-aspartate oxidase
MEFIQFHPTCLYHPQAKSFLISEAVRGEGGLLRCPTAPLHARHDARAELAPRDVVARAIDFEMKKRGLDCVYLDISHNPPTSSPSTSRTSWRAAWNWASTSRASRFRSCRRRTTPAAASSPTCARAPTCPASTRRRTSCTGLHGANRLASNSLLECLVFAKPRPRHSRAPGINAAPAAWDESRVSDPDEEIVIAHNWDELRRFMWDYVGIVRTNKRLQRAQHRIRLLSGKSTSTTRTSASATT